jgi:hypothetical protein
VSSLLSVALAGTEDNDAVINEKGNAIIVDDEETVDAENVCEVDVIDVVTFGIVVNNDFCEVDLLVVEEVDAEVLYRFSSFGFTLRFLFAAFD